MTGTEASADEFTPPSKMNVLWLIFLTVTTFGFYYALWFAGSRKSINSLRSHAKLSLNVLIIFIGLSAITSALMVASFISSGMGAETLSEMLAALAEPSSWATLIIEIVYSFRVRRALLDHASSLNTDAVTVSWILTLIFSCWYLQYKINRLSWAHKYGTVTADPA